MDEEFVYECLEDKMLRAEDYRDVEVAAPPMGPDGQRHTEPLVRVPQAAALTRKLIDARMHDYAVQDEVQVRWGVLARLRAASALLVERDPLLQLEVVYGYRAMPLQQKMYAEARSKLQQELGLDGAELDAAAHRRIALPEVAGHPTGGAVDVHLKRGDEALPFGTRIWDFDTKSAYTFSPFISTEAWHNRQLLRTVMMQAGFAPFDGEWWHFSYGDREWARYYGKPAALYDYNVILEEDLDRHLEAGATRNEAAKAAGSVI